MKKICFVTGSRAEYGIMRRLLTRLDQDEDIQLDLVVTAMHLEEKYGYTLTDIERDGFTITKKIYLQLTDTSKATIVHSLATLTDGLIDVFSSEQYDLVIILGDRYEMLPVANVALIFTVPICHIHGGEKTLGNFDESIRHAITKMSHLHLTSTEEFRKRVIQLGESPQRVKHIGSMGVENVLLQDFLSKEELSCLLNIELEENYYVVLFHPVTLENQTAVSQTEALVEALKKTGTQCIVIGSNSDTSSDAIMQVLHSFVEENVSCHLFSSLPTQYFHSLVKHSKGLLGNSSSGLIEVPSLQVPTLNIGNRQLGRVSGPSVCHVSTRTADIVLGLDELEKISDFTNPYEKADSSFLAYSAIKEFLTAGDVVMKDFYDLKCDEEII
ncbi:UDP-N-acetylglucosamine 2-epimerase [Streptococcus ruminantium]|uniref:UDP-N-acetylglucosamine 2-epimerase n=1 Tax=Streptococcus ruminantium TaxID=1917441 RepID=UPI001F01916F|nr:UDP-N-acetylglucosamine 2-epimerase [Streptococcus ruminantium]BDD39039.1 UDP-N-acetyl glucosamine 2-epimerase [Streptococcus ruminantium]